MTSNAAAEEIQQIVKAERASAIEQSNEFEISKSDESTDLAVTYQDDFSGAIKFLESPITENFLVDIKEQLRVEFEKSFRNLKDYDFLENEIKKSNNSGQKITGKEKEKTNNLKAAVLERLSTMFLPEFLNRLDDIIIFQPLRPEELRKICDIMIKEVSERVKSKQILLSVDDKVKAKLTREGYNPLFGARPLRRLVTKYIEDLISENILKTPIAKKARVVKIVLNEDDQVVVKADESN
jgi:ATP-dependent Clp protease ATP-binding subunit ClpA